MVADRGEFNVDLDGAWPMLRAIPAAIDTAAAFTAPAGLRLEGSGGIVISAAPSARDPLVMHPPRTLTRNHSADGEGMHPIVELYLPLCAGAVDRPFVIGQLGQSLDGRIALHNGASHYITGPQNLDHLHRLRALCDAVIVGRETARMDDPRLTTRRVSGRDPVRVLLDSRGELTNWQGNAATGAGSAWVFHGPSVTAGYQWAERAHRVELDPSGGLDPRQVIDVLWQSGIRRVLVEGGGLTVSSFLAHGLLDRLHLAVAPLIIGSGRPSISLPQLDELEHALRPGGRWFAMGEDMLFDCVPINREG